MFEPFSSSSADRRKLQIRLNVLAILLLLSLAVIFGRTARLAMQGGSPERRRLERSVQLPALRGRILTADGIELVSSRRYFRLLSTLPPDKTLSTDDRNALLQVLPRCDFDHGPQLADDLLPGELLKLYPLLRKGLPVSVVSEENRVFSAAAAELRDELGSTVIGPDGELAGASGWEQKYDMELRGMPGSALILSTRRGLVKGSFRILCKPVKGQDVKLPYTLQEIKEGKR